MRVMRTALVKSVSLSVLLFGLAACGSGTQLDQETLELLSSSRPSDPKIILKGENPAFVEVNTSYQESGYDVISIGESGLEANVKIAADSLNVKELGNYRITYTVTNSKGLVGQAVRQVVVRDTTPPSIILNGNQNFNLERTESFNDPGASVTDNYDASDELSLSISGEVNSDQVGTYPVKYQSVDSSGNVGELIRNVIVIDTRRPVVVIDQPTDGFQVNVTNQNSILVSGTCSEEFNLEVTNGSDTNVVACNESAWSTSLDFSALPDGAVSVSASMTDPSGNESLPVSVDGVKNTQLAVVTFDDQDEIYYANQDNYRNLPLSGDCSEPGQTVDVRAVGSVVRTAEATCNGSNRWATTIDLLGLANGSFNLEADHSSAAGNPAPTATREAFLDTIDPSVNIQNPAEDFIINSDDPVAAIPVSGSCSENTQTVVVENLSASGPADEDTVTCSSGSFSATLDFSGIPDGEVQIRATHFDIAGNSDEDIHTGTKDTGAASVSILSPADGDYISASQAANLNVSGDCSESGQNVRIEAMDSVGDSVVENRICTGGQTYSRNLNISSLSEGSITIKSDHSDSAGNPSPTAMVSVILDKTPAELQILQPQQGSFVNAANQTNFPVTVNCSEAGEVVVSNPADSSSASCDGNTTLYLDFSSASLAEGATIQITAQHTDLAGNPSAEQSVDVVKDTVGPKINRLVNPSDGFVIALEDTSFVVSGGCDTNGNNVSVKILSNSVTVFMDNTVSCASNSFQRVLNQSEVDGLPEGELVVSVRHTEPDAAGNPPEPAITVTGNKESPGPEITLIGDDPLIVDLCDFEDPGASVDGQTIYADLSEVNTKRAGSFELTYTFTAPGSAPSTPVTRQVSINQLSLGGQAYTDAIISAEDLANIDSTGLGRSYALCNDIDLDSISDFSQVGSSNKFSGSFHGQNFTIRNLKVGSSAGSGGTDNAGLFFETDETALIRNLFLEDISIDADDRSGGLVGVNEGRIEQVHLRGGYVIADTNNPSEEDIGGLVGINLQSGEIVESSIEGINIEGDRRVGGLVGHNRGLVQDSYTRVTVTARASSAAQAGGLIGRQNGSDGSVSKSYAAGSVFGQNVRGLIGANAGTDNVLDSFWDNEVAGLTPDPETSRYGHDRTTSEMKTESTFTDFGWNFDGLWIIDELINLGYPSFR